MATLTSGAPKPKGWLQPGGTSEKKAKKPPHTSRLANRRLRQFQFHLKEVQQVIAFVNEHGKITDNDLPKIPWVRGFQFKTHSQLKLPAGAHNQSRLFVMEGTPPKWKWIVPKEDVQKMLRNEILKEGSKMPLTRDAGFHHLKDTTVGISRRALWVFLEKQNMLQVTRNIPNERKKGGVAVEQRGHVEIDLVHISKDLLHDHELTELHEMFSEDLRSKDGYLCCVIDQLTSYGLAAIQRRKTAIETAETLGPLLTKLSRKLKTPIVRVQSDQGKEFLGAVSTLFKKRSIKHKTVARASKVEMFNQILQRSFYRLLRLERGSVNSCLRQAIDIVNNTYNKNLGMTPEEAAAGPDSAIRPKYKVTRQESDMEYMRTQKPKVGDKCRYLVNYRKLIRKPSKGIYKAYKGDHFSSEIVKIRKVDEKLMRYYCGGAWRDRDQIMLVSGVDQETIDRVAAREAKHPKETV